MAPNFECFSLCAASRFKNFDCSFGLASLAVGGLGFGCGGGALWVLPELTPESDS